MKLADELAQEIFEGRHRTFQGEFTDWLSESRRFRSFAETYASKIRKKLRVANDEDSLLDVRCELETAFRLLQDKKFTLEYEKYGAVEGRGPDLTVTLPYTYAAECRGDSSAHGGGGRR